MMKPVRVAALVMLVAVASGRGLAQGAPASWLQWGGPDRNFIVESGALAEEWPEEGPPIRWSRPLGTGHSAIVADGDMLFTMYRPGNGQSRSGPWEATESVIALEAATGETVRERTYASRLEDFSYGAGPHSTPLVVGDRLFAFGTNRQLHAFDKRTGEILWSHWRRWRADESARLHEYRAAGPLRVMAETMCGALVSADY